MSGSGSWKGHSREAHDYNHAYPLMDCKVIVPSTLIPGSKLLLVGESPGREECAQGKGFAGPAGRVLQRACRLAGLDWDQCSLSNVTKRPPEGGYSSDYFRKTFYETQETPTFTKTGKVAKKVRRITVPTQELQEYVSFLQKEIQQLQPNVVVAVGAEACQVLTGKVGISNYRGSVLESTLVPGQKVIPIIHPSFIQRGQWSDFWPMVYDLKKARREMEFPEIKREPYSELYPTSVEEVQEFLQQITGYYSLDIETRGGSIACIGVGCRSRTGYMGACIPIQTTRSPFWALADEFTLWQALNGLCKNPLLVGQNLFYDLTYLKDYELKPSGIWMDTMNAHCLLYPEWTQGYKGLDFITSFYLDDVVYYKNEGKTWGSRTPDEDLWRYNLKDVIHTLRASEKIEEQLVQRGLSKKYHEEIVPLSFLALEMMDRRLLVNEANRLLLDRLLQKELITAHNSLTEQLGHEINVESPKQIQSLLYKTLHLPLRHKRGSHKVTADENALRELRTVYPNPILDRIIQERHLLKRKGTFIDAELEDE